MKEVIRTNDVSMVSFITHALEEAGVKPFVFDVNASIMEGSIGILPRRVMVTDDDYAKARTVLHDAGLAHELEKQKE